MYLTPLDQAMEGLCKKNWIRYQRLMDDYVIFDKTRNKLKAAIKRMYAVRARRLHEKGADSRRPPMQT